MIQLQHFHAHLCQKRAHLDRGNDKAEERNVDRFAGLHDLGERYSAGTHGKHRATVCGRSKEANRGQLHPVATRDLGRFAEGHPGHDGPDNPDYELGEGHRPMRMDVATSLLVVDVVKCVADIPAPGFGKVRNP